MKFSFKPQVSIGRFFSNALLMVIVLGMVTCSESFANETFQDNAGENKADESNWISLFNGKDLEGWTVKIAGHPVGENFANTFRVEDGILKCEYDDYGPFNKQFGHLYSNLAYSHYKLRLQYRFVGRMLPDAPNYVDLNSGVMLHSQSPQSMRLDQGFPASLEMQFLASLGKGKRQTGNVCTPGTHLNYDGQLTKQHIVKSSGPTLPADQWVAVEMEVHGHELIIYRVEGKEVLRYRFPVLDPESEEAQDILALGADRKLSFGHIALQAEAQRVWFRNIELLPLAE
ncbi:MAG: 3-keto-disaccharide hydrolase [Mariniblastus sp.]